MHKGKTNQYQELCEEMYSLIESIGMSLSYVPDEYADEDDCLDADAYERYLEDMEERMRQVSQVYLARLIALNPKYAEKSPLHQIMEEAKRGYLTKLEEESDAARVAGVIIRRDSYRPPVLSIVQNVTD